MIELRELCAGYPGRPVLRKVNIACRPGQVTVLCGPNGCGKSTALKVAARLLEPTAGQVFVDGRPAASYSSRQFAKRVALLPQMRAAANLTARSLVLHGRFPYLGYPRRYTPADHQIVREAMERTGTWAFPGAPVSSLSGGERQKVYLAMCLAQDTPVLLLDEPTTYLDIAHQLELMALVRDLAREGRTVFMVLHDLNLAMTNADQVIVMDAGAVCQAGAPVPIYRSGVIERVFAVRALCTEDADGRPQYLLSKVAPKGAP